MIESLDWRWQLQNSIKNIDQFNACANLSPEQKKFLDENFKKISLPFQVTPYFLSLMGKNVDCPIFRQVIPSIEELNLDPEDLRDPLGEEVREKSPFLIHRYPDRVLFLLTDRCASYCRYCTRKRLVGQGPSPKNSDRDQAFSYIFEHPEIKEVIFSGGEPLLMNDDIIQEALKRSFAIPHVEVVRIHSRMLSFAPMRITDELCGIFKQFSPIYLVTHFNHEQELTDEALKAISRLIEAGVIMLNQSVLLAKINDEPKTLEKLFRKLIKNRIKPYYLHQCDVVTGASHFRVPLEKSLDIMKSLRGHISGLCMPTLVVDIPGGFGKVPLVSNPIVKEDEDFIYLQGFNGQIARYPKR